MNGSPCLAFLIILWYTHRLIAAPAPHHPTQLPSPSLLHIITMSQSNASRRSSTVQSFKVMDVLQRANQLESQGRTIYHCEVGQPESGAVSLLLFYMWIN